MRLAQFTVPLILMTAGIPSGRAWAQANEDAKPVIDRGKARQFFDQAMSRFDAFEQAHGRWVQTTNIRMHYLQWGSANGVPLLWAHGTYSSAYEMAPVADDLVKAGYRIIAIDYYGHGRTGVPLGNPSIYSVADDMAALMDSLGMDKAIIGGWSRGGAIAAAFYDDYPERTLGLALEDGGSFSFQTVYDRLTDEQLQSRFAFLPDSSTPPPSFETAFDAFYEAIQGDSMFDTSDPTYHFLVLAQLTQDADSGWTFNRAMTPLIPELLRGDIVEGIRRPSTSTLFNWSTAAAMPSVIFRHLGVPVLIIDPTIDDDALLATDENRDLQEAFPQLVTHRIYENTSHAAHLERPAWFIRDMSMFLERVRTHVNR